MTTERIWELLKEYGITSMEEFEKKTKETHIDISVFTLPLNKVKEG